MSTLLATGMGPFVFAAALVIGFLILEVLFMLVGLDTRIGGDTDLEVDIPEASLDVDADLSVEIPDGIEFDAEIDPDMDAVTAAGGSGGILDLFGMRKLPMTVWLSFFSAFYAASGFVGQGALDATMGFKLPAMIAGFLALIPAAILTRYASEMAANWLPKEESTAISQRNFGRRRGTITVGVASRGRPAQVKFTDGHGNLHYVMAEPLENNTELSAGEEVLIIRTREGDLRLLPLA